MRPRREVPEIELSGPHDVVDLCGAVLTASGRTVHYRLEAGTGKKRRSPFSEMHEAEQNDGFKLRSSDQAALGKQVNETKQILPDLMVQYHMLGRTVPPYHKHDNNLLLSDKIDGMLLSL